MQKLRGSLANPIAYELPIGDSFLPLNELIGRDLTLTHTGPIHCVACGRITRKSYNQGFCYPCFQRLARCDLCIVKPEQCHFAAGTCREPQWAETNCLQPHVVYLSVTSGLKVGITRGTQIPTRWIDQGAAQALPIFAVTSRHNSGLLEVLFKQRVADRTDWRHMLRGAPPPLDLLEARDGLVAACQLELERLEEELGPGAFRFLPEERPLFFEYPLGTYPEKVRALNLDKTTQIQGRLEGIKGQYLMFDVGVLNVRKFAGYHLQLRF